MKYAEEVMVRYYSTGGRRHTCEEAITLLKVYRDKNYFLPPWNWGRKQVRKRIHERCLFHELIRRIHVGPEKDPVFIIAYFIGQMDDVVSRRDSTSRNNWAFADSQKSCAWEILDFLR